MSYIIEHISQAVQDFNEAIPDIEKEIFKGVSSAIKSLDTDADGNIKLTANNLKIINKVKKQIDRIILNENYTGNVAQFLNAFTDISALHNEYFKGMVGEYAPPTIIKEVQSLAIESTLNSLTEAGISANISQPIYDILRTNTTTGANYTDMLQTVRDYIVTSGENDGALKKYAGQITTDSLNQYSAQYQQIVSSDLGLDWYTYNGAIIETSRCWCRAMVKKKYVHRSEFQLLIEGAFSQFDALSCTIYKKTGLPNGMIEGTNPSNLLIYRGGYGCEHQFTAVSAALVPKDIRAAFE